MGMVTDNGKRRYPADMEPGIPLDGKSLAFQYKDGQWTTTDDITVSASGITELYNPEINSPIEYYDLQGRRVYHPGKGIYLVKRGGRVCRVIL